MHRKLRNPWENLHILKKEKEKKERLEYIQGQMYKIRNSVEDFQSWLT